MVFYTEKSKKQCIFMTESFTFEKLGLGKLVIFKKSTLAAKSKLLNKGLFTLNRAEREPYHVRGLNRNRFFFLNFFY